MIDETSKYGVQVEGDFTWETTQAAAAKFTAGGRGARGGRGGRGGRSGRSGAPSTRGEKKKGKNGKKDAANGVLPTTAQDVTEKQPSAPEKTPEDDKPFALHDVSMKVPRGAFIAIVGKVGSGKSSLLQALTGEMRRTRGDVCFLLSLSFCLC